MCFVNRQSSSALRLLSSNSSMSISLLLLFPWWYRLGVGLCRSFLLFFFKACACGSNRYLEYGGFSIKLKAIQFIHFIYSISVCLIQPDHCRLSLFLTRAACVSRADRQNSVRSLSSLSSLLSFRFVYHTAYLNSYSKFKIMSINWSVPISCVF